MEQEPNGWSTEFWLTRWRGGDLDAGGRLYERFCPLLRLAVKNGKSWRRLRRDFEIDDVVDGLWAALFPDAAAKFTYRGPDSFVAWLQTALHRREVDLLRLVSRGKRGGGTVVKESDVASEDRESALLPAPAPSPTPSSSARANEMLEEARSALRGEEYTAFVLTKLEGYTSEEAGLALRRSGAAVRALVDRALKKLLAAFGGVAAP